MEEDWEPTKEDTKRRNWSDQEITAMLNLVLKHNLLSLAPTDSQIGETLVAPMLKLGYHRTSHQIKLKNKSLRKAFLRSKRNLPNTVQNSPFYEILSQLYKDDDAKVSESEDENEMDEGSFIWTESEIKRMVAIIKQTDLAHELSLGSFPMKALRQIRKSLRSSCIHKTIDQIRKGLENMRSAYARCKKSLAKQEECVYFEQLDELWKRDYAKGHFHKINKDLGDFWTTEETIFLLESIKGSKVTMDAYYCTEDAVKMIQEALGDGGYSRSEDEIVRKLENLKKNYMMVKGYTKLDEAIAKFPFYDRYKSLFGDVIEASIESDDGEKSNDDMILLGERCN